MALAYMQSGQRFEMKGSVYELDRHLGSEWQYFDISTKKSSQISIDVFQSEYLKGGIKFVVFKSAFIPSAIKLKNGELVAAHLENFNINEQELMKRRRIFLESILKKYGDTRSQKQLSIACKELWDTNWGAVPSPSTVARFMKRYIESDRDIRSLNSGNCRKGNRSSRYHFDVIDMCNNAIQNVYLQLARGSIKKTLDEAKRLIYVENLVRVEGHMYEYPKYSYIKTLIGSIPEYEKYLKRYGTNAARNKFRNSVHGVFCNMPLERVEVDHTQLNLQVLDDKTGLLIGRPWLTVATDVYSRAIVGFHLSFEPPSQLTVAKVLKMALLPKMDIKKRWPSITNIPFMYGCMRTLAVDNGLEFHGNSIESACYELGITILYCPRKTPWWKARIERLLGTINRDVTDGMPGRTFSSIQERAEYDSIAHALVTFTTAEEYIAKWIFDVYHYTTHRTLGLRPEEAWASAMADKDIPLVPSVEDLDAITGIIAKRTHTHDGIQLNDLIYNSDELGEVYKRYGYKKNVRVKWDSGDMGHIYYFVPDGSVIKVPVKTKYTEYASGLTHYRHLANKAYAKKYHPNADDFEGLILAKKGLKELVEKDFQSKSKKTRIQSYRLIDIKNSKPISVSQPVAEQPLKNTQPLTSNTPRPKFPTSNSKRKQG
jgi:putative transposase